MAKRGPEQPLKPADQPDEGAPAHVSASGPRQSKKRPSPARAPGTKEEDMPEDLQAIFGENLQAERMKSGLKQSDVAERTGMTKQFISRIETGQQNLTLRTMMQLAKLFNRNVSSMLLRAGGRRTKE